MASLEIKLTFIQKGEIIGYVAKRNIAECDYACEREERPKRFK